jgi:hypothetical protein
LPAEHKNRKEFYMEKNRFFILGLLAVTLTFGLVLAGCDNGTTSGGGDPQMYLLQGSFASGGGTATFYADVSGAAPSMSVKAARSISRAAVTQNSILTGKIEDGDIILNLKGSYETETKIFILSASASSIGLTYKLEGKLDSNGSMVSGSAKATISVKQENGEWTATEVAITTAKDVSIDNEAQASGTALPDAWLGKWVWASDPDYYYIVSSNAITCYYKDHGNSGQWLQDAPLTFSEITKSGENYDCVMVAPADLSAGYMAYRLEKKDSELIIHSLGGNPQSYTSWQDWWDNVALPGGEDYQRTHTPYIPDDGGEPTDPGKVYTMVFDTYKGAGGYEAAKSSLVVPYPDASQYLKR